MEDTKDKLRRNLVIFSALILLGAFLNIEPSRTGFWAPEILKEVDQLRLHIAILAVLVYLSFRWFSSAEQKNEFQKLKRIWFQTMEDLCRKDGSRTMEKDQEKDYSPKAQHWLAANRGRNRLLEGPSTP